jgi:hypothetical protein
MRAAPAPVAELVRGTVRRPRLRPQDHVGLAFGALLLASLLLTSFVLLDAQEDSGRRALGERFAARSVLGAAFVTHFVQDLAERETARATRAMSSTGSHDEAMVQAVDAFGLDAAVELDAAGRLLAVWPPRPDISGPS